MLTLETAIEKIKQLPLEKQKQVFQLIEALDKKAQDPDETSTEEAIAGITQGLKEAFDGQTLPLSQMWDGTDVEQWAINYSSKRYRSIRQDITPLIKQLQKGEVPGDRISGNKYQVIKACIKNTDIQKGKSAGYRVIYYLKTKNVIILITIYSKSDLTDVPNKTIEEIIQTFESNN